MIVLLDTSVLSMSGLLKPSRFMVIGFVAL